METWLEFGFAGVMAGITFQALGIAKDAIKAKINGGKAGEGPGNGAVMAELKTIKSNQAVLQTEMARVVRVVVDGNGGEPMTVQVAKIQQKLADHVGDKGLHTAER